MTPAPRPAKPAVSPPDLSAMPAFVRALRGIAHVPKAEVDAAIQKEGQDKKKNHKPKE